jgi:ATP-dependent Clp protease adaptor protein ClpS
MLTKSIRAPFVVTVSSSASPIKPISPEAAEDIEGDVQVLTESPPLEALPPPLYQVWMLNDDFTPMEFVVYALQEFFSKEHEAAVQIMLKIHTEGRGVCGVYPRDIAVTKVSMVMDAAKNAGHPLQVVCEPLQG